MMCALGACAPDQQPQQKQADTPAASSTPAGPTAPGQAAGEAPAEGHQWFARNKAGRRWAGYGPPFSEAAFSVQCEGSRLTFNTAEMPPSGPGPTQMRLAFGGHTEAVSAVASEEGLPNTSAEVPADAQWLSKLLAASGNLSVTVGGSDPLSVPISEPLRSLIRDCTAAAR